MASEHDRDRLTKGAQEFFDNLLADEDAPTDIALDTFIIIGIVSWEDEDGDQQEGPVAWCEVKRTYTQRGIVEMMLDRMRLSSMDVIDDGPDPNT